MPMRKICDVCGAINKPDDYACNYCNADISETIKRNIEFKKDFKFYNTLTNEFSNAPLTNTQPTQNCENSTKITAPNTTETTQEPQNEYFKKCAACGKINSAELLDCECGASLRRVQPNLIQNLQLNESSKQKETPAKKDCNSANQPKYDLFIGLNGENKVPVVFNNGFFLIGRNYQNCLENDPYISRHHCFLKQVENGDIYLAEHINSPSTNGTFLRITGDRRERLNPGEEYKINSGDVFYLGSTPMSIRQRL